MIPIPSCFGPFFPPNHILIALKKMYLLTRFRCHLTGPFPFYAPGLHTAHVRNYWYGLSENSRRVFPPNVSRPMRQTRYYKIHFVPWWKPVALVIMLFHIVLSSTFLIRSVTVPFLHHIGQPVLRFPFLSFLFFSLLRFPLILMFSDFGLLTVYP